jgi:aminoglycoside phosphotransferase (APT) family kinase protein
MHLDEVDVDASLVRRLLATQFPQWADRPVEKVSSSGTDNAIYRLGDDMAVRLPRIQGATGQVVKEQRWLPRLAPYLPLAIPAPLAMGTPAEGYPWHWSVYQWLEGDDATVERITDLRQAARELASFVTALQRIDPTGGPPPGKHNSFRGVPLGMRDAETLRAIEALRGILDASEVAAAWETTLRAPEWERPPVWVHGDFLPTNFLVERGALGAVIDFGCLGVGDPACDLLVAWALFSGESRDVFHSAVQADDATWARGRGWALSFGLIALLYYQKTNPGLAGIARHTIDEVLADHIKP